MMERTRTIVVGWDGATFDIIKPLVDRGLMPNVASLMRDGAWGRLESTIPPLTPVAWTSISTGVNPGKHAIYDAMVYRPEQKRIVFSNATMRAVRPVWSILSDKGRKSGVMNVPLTYPPDEFDGFSISGMFTPDGADDFITPPGLKAEIEGLFGKYMIECRQESDPGAYLKRIVEMMDYREKVCLYLIERKAWDFFFAVFMATDRVQHFFWKYLDPRHPEHSRYGGAVAEVYIRLDAALGRIIEKAGPDTNVMMVSDHGSGPLNAAFFLNNWLLKKGYLTLKQDMASALRAKNGSRIMRGLARSLRQVLPNAGWGRTKPGGDESINVFYSLIDFEKTTAFSEGVAGAIYINPDLSPAQYLDVTSRLIGELCEIRDGAGKRVIAEVYRREDIYSGEHAHKAPDLTLICSPGYQIIAPNEFLFFRKAFEDSLFLSHRWSGRHERHGIFLLKGPAVRKGVVLDNPRIIDVTPTILHLMDMAVPAYMDGAALEQALEPEYLARKPVRYTDDAATDETEAKKLSEEQEKDIAEKLKNLGYME
ncbi:MAG: alkaline phosphatase family protein [Deltaproteobacteria bacterium]|nr:alkaline phosphatase family protein [Deltaproteobacteria bacterium]